MLLLFKTGLGQPVLQLRKLPRISTGNTSQPLPASPEELTGQTGYGWTSHTQDWSLGQTQHTSKRVQQKQNKRTHYLFNCEGGLILPCHSWGFSYCNLREFRRDHIHQHGIDVRSQWPWPLVQVNWKEKIYQGVPEMLGSGRVTWKYNTSNHRCHQQWGKMII